MNTGQLLQAGKKHFQFFFIMYIQSDITMKNAILRFNGDGIDIDFEFAGN